MVKQHSIKLTIKNSTNFPLTFHESWFESGRLADHFKWPKTIMPQQKETIVCYERNWSMAGCSGYVQYLMNQSLVTIGFSNPSAGTNKVGINAGLPGMQVWEQIESHDYQDFQVNFKAINEPITACCNCTGGTTNNAEVTLFQTFKTNHNNVYPPPNQNGAYPPPPCYR